MSLTGLFLILFLLVHLIGNLQLLHDDNGLAFNLYAYTMTTNPIIKTISYGLYFFILVHAVQGILIARKNKNSRKTGYLVTTSTNTSFASRNMAILGVIIFIFILIHMWQFWFQYKFGGTTYIAYEGHEKVKDLNSIVEYAYSHWYYVVFYVISMIILGMHLWHGFESAFQTLGINHKKYSPLISSVGKAYSIIVALLFAIIPIIMYLFPK
jgi:succinate dehydrogenase / fumarate reductase cytochrome b subunit